MTRISKADSALCQPNGYTFNHQIYVRVRITRESDVPHLHKLIYHMALSHNLPFEATEASISDNLFKSGALPDFESFTGLILEVSQHPFSKIPDYPTFSPIVQKLDIAKPITDTESELFRSSGQSDLFIAGYMLFYPLCFSFLEKPGYFIDNMYIRECYRSMGLGTMMFTVVASHAATKGYSMVDPLVADSDVNNIKILLDGMGVRVVEDFRFRRLSSDVFQAYVSDDASHDRRGIHLSEFYGFYGN